MRLLMVDDEPAILRAVTQFLAARGFEVDAAPSLERALALVRRGTFDVVLTDLELGPGRRSEGFELLEELHRDSPQTETVLLTAYRTAGVDERAESLGVARVLNKPIPLPELADEIGRLAK